jgi:hypothetical protein
MKNKSSVGFKSDLGKSVNLLWLKPHEDALLCFICEGANEKTTLGTASCGLRNSETKHAALQTFVYSSCLRFTRKAHKFKPCLQASL